MFFIFCIDVIKSVPEVLSSEGDEFEIKAIAININGKHINDVTDLHIGVALYHYVLWNWYYFWCGNVLFFVPCLLCKKVICCSTFCSFLMSLIMSGIFGCNSPMTMVSSYS